MIFCIFRFLLKNVHYLLELKLFFLLIFSIISFCIWLYVSFGAPRLEMADTILFRWIWWIFVALKIKMRTKLGLMKFEWESRSVLHGVKLRLRDVKYNIFEDIFNLKHLLFEIAFLFHFRHIIPHRSYVIQGLLLLL